MNSVEKGDRGFTVRTAEGRDYQSQYLLLASGPANPLAESLRNAKAADGLAADRNGRTSVDGLYVIGWSTRLKKIQAIISAGDGACAALDILSAKAGEDIHDFDVIEGE